jgi:hypothetical protein
MTLSNLGRLALAALIGPITDHFNWQISLVSFSMMMGIAWLLMQFLNLKKHSAKIEALENQDAQNLAFTEA